MAEPRTGAAGAAAAGWLPSSAAQLFGEGASAEEAYGLLTVDVPATAWISALKTARDALGCTYFDWLSAVDEPGEGFRVLAHLVALPGSGGEAAPGVGGGREDGEVDPDGEPAGAGGRVRRLLVRTTVPHNAPALPTATGLYAGAGWHERETHEMFGIDFTGHPHLVPLLLPDGFEGHPLRKDFVLAARVAKAWPGAKEPGEPEHGGPKRRQMLPPGVPDPGEWGPLKGRLPSAPSRPARGAPAPADRPARRTRRASEGSASQQAPAPAERPAPRGRTSDAPWHHPRPATQEPGAGPRPEGTGAEGSEGGEST